MNCIFISFSSPIFFSGDNKSNLTQSQLIFDDAFNVEFNPNISKGIVSSSWLEC